MDKATVESVMALAFELARIREQHGAQSGMYLSEVRALRAEAERLAAQAAPTEPPQEFESAQGRALASAWAEGWAQCRDAEYVGEEAESEAFNQSATLAQCLYADQTRFQGGLSNDQLRRAWSAKLPNVIPTDEQLTAFALGIEAAAQPSQAPVVQAVPVNCGTGYCSCIECVVEPVAWVYWHPSDTTYDGPDTLHKKAVSRFTDDTRKAMMAKGWLFEPLYPAAIDAALTKGQP